MLPLLDAASTSQDNFSAERKFIPLVDDRDLVTYSVSICYSLYREYVSRSQRENNPLKAIAKELFPSLGEGGCYPDQPWTNGESSARLIGFFHGLNSSPLCWSKYVQKLSEGDKSTSYFAPYVYNKGYCKLKEAAKPIFEVIQNYAREYPNNPIILVGHSNGARISQYIHMKSDAKNIILVSISGPHLGSKMVDWTTYVGLNARFGITDEMKNELMYDNEWANRKLEKWQKKSIEKVDKIRKQIFIASADDLRAFPNDTSFPNLPNSTYWLISGESHVTIVDAVCEVVLNEALV